MKVTVRWVLGGVLAAVFAIGGVAGLGGIADATPPAAQAQGGVPLLHASLVPSMPTDAPIFTVTPGGIPWSIAAGHALLSSNGALQVTVARLIDPTPPYGYNPVPYIAASVYCGGSLVATTGTVPFSHQGNAHLRATVTLPTTCTDPAVLLNPATAPTTLLPVYIASGGAVS